MPRSDLLSLLSFNRKYDSMWQNMVWIALAGAVGTVCRYAIAALVQRLCGSDFPWGTLLVNGLGCFLFGLVWAVADERLGISGEHKLIVLTGFMGAFTTFSTFAFETSAMLKDAQWWIAAANVFGHNALGVACVFLGFAASRLW